MAETIDDSDSTEAEYKNLTCERLKGLLKGRGLAVAGKKSQLIDRLLGREEHTQATQPPISVNQHIIDFGHGEIELARLEQKRIRLLSMTNKALKDILRARKQAVGGKKTDLVNRILGLEENKSNKRIQDSKAARILRRDIYEGNDLHRNGDLLESDALYHTRAVYREYSLHNFSQLLDALRSEHQQNKKSAAHDDELVRKQLKHLNGMAVIDERGFTCWRVHPGRKLLEIDVANQEHKKKKARRSPAQ